MKKNKLLKLKSSVPHYATEEIDEGLGWPCYDGDNFVGWWEGEFHPADGCEGNTYYRNTDNWEINDDDNLQLIKKPRL